MANTVPDEVEDLLTGDPVVAHLATCSDGRPHAAPLWFRYEDGVVELMTTGKKLDNIRANPRVALSLQQGENGHPSWMVTIRGTATVVSDEDENRTANRLINRRYDTGDPDDWSENTLVRVDIGSVSHKIY